MGVAAGTLNGNRATGARTQIPKWGCWWADVSLDGEVTLSGAAELVIADLTLKGTILSGGPGKGRSEYRIVGGKGGWGKTIAKKDYANDAGVKVAEVLTGAAQDAGESLVTSSTAIVGPKYVRPAGPASSVLELLARGAWYVAEDGTTRTGARPTTALAIPATRIEPVDRARGMVTLASDSIATLLPGVTVDGLEAIDVMHSLDPKKGLRTTIWGARGPSTSRRLAAFRTLLEQLLPDLKYRAPVRYRVVTKEGKRYNLQPFRVSTGMPDLRRVRVMPGVAGCEADLTLGSLVLVVFIEADPGLPAIVAFADPDDDGFVPIKLEIAGGSDFVALATSVGTQLTTLKTAIAGAVIVPLDGGASFKAALLTALASWPGSVAASKVKAT